MTLLRWHRRVPRVDLAVVFASLALAASGAVSAQSMSVTSEPAGARVEIDGVYVGTTPILRDVAAGRRTVRVRRAGFAVWQREIDVAADRSAEVQARLERLFGTLELDGLPPGAVVTVDGETVDPTSAIGVGLADVVVQVAGQPPARQRVAVADGGVTRVAYTARHLDPTRVATSLVAPGSVQIAGRRPLAGVAVLAGVASGVGVALAANSRINRITPDYDQAVFAYRDARSETDVEKALARIRDHTDRAERLRTTRRIAFGAAAAAYLAGTLDVLLHHAFRPSLRSEAPRLPPVSVHVQDAGVSLAVRF